MMSESVQQQVTEIDEKIAREIIRKSSQNKKK